VLFRLDPARPVPLADQVAANVRRGIADGTVAPGERLPPARELAASLDVSIHTVLAGYQQLRDEDLIELRRGRGATVRDGVRSDRAVLLGLVHDLVAAARRIDLDEDELVALVRSTASGP
jgi:DNA-binding transcriptional regulator YhcF (GntR family)